MRSGGNSDLAKLGAHINNIALHHIVFALPFAYMSAFLAAGGMPPVMDLVWITVAIAGARSAALARGSSPAVGSSSTR